MRNILHFCSLLLLTSAPAFTDAFGEAPPETLLRNEKIAVAVYVPHPETGYYRGPRFDWSGIVRRVSLGKHSFFGEWKPKSRSPRHG